jgi:REP element-mobilizing transposase RayT
MVLAYHLVLTGYGHWLPNDPRGSASREIMAGKLFPLGSIQPVPDPDLPEEEVHAFRINSEPLLEHAILWFDWACRKTIANSFSCVVAERRYTCYACAIMANHAHLVIRKHRDQAEVMIRELKCASAKALRSKMGIDASHPVWSSQPFKVFLNNGGDIRRTIEYVEQNPIKAGEPAQRFDFVKPYRGEWDRRTAK